MAKLEDIPKLLQSHYTVTIPFLHIPESLDRYKTDQEDTGFKFELNPVFQRGHVWTSIQQSKYIEWVVMGGESGLDVYFNHERWMSDFRADMVCVDGLQRLTAINLFLNDGVKIWGKRFSEYDDPKYLNRRYLRFNIGAHNQQNVLRWYLQMNSGGTVHSKEELDKVKQMIEEL